MESYIEVLKDFNKKRTTYLRKLEKLSEDFTEALKSRIDEIAPEVILNILTTGWRHDIANEVVETYYEEVYGISINGYYLIDLLKDNDYIYSSREEVAWGEHDYFIYLREKGKKIRDGEVGKEALVGKK